MTFKSRVLAVLLPGLGLFLPLAVLAQENNRTYTLQAGFGLEYFSRSLVWDEKTKSSPLKAGFGLFRFGFELPGGAGFAVLAGYGVNNWNGLVFRQLPFSIDYQAGTIGSILLGTEIEAPVFKSGDWEIGASGRFLVSIGTTKEWTLEDLNQTGALDGRADWMKIQAGPTLTYRGFEAFSPYLAVFYDRMWGTFTLNETFEPLSGSEEKKITGQGVIGGSFGMIYDPTTSLRIRAEGSLLPYKKLDGGLSFNVGGSLRVLLSF